MKSLEVNIYINYSSDAKLSKSNLKDSYTGAVYTITHCEGALDSFHQVVSKLTKNKANSLKRQMIAQIERLANGHKLARGNFVKEGKLPKKSGQTTEKSFYALKRIPVRAYLWRSQKHKNTYFISHYIYKDQQKLSSKDEDRVCSNWRTIEE